MQHSCPYPQRTRPQRSRQHQLQRRRPQRSRQQFRHLTKSRSPLGPLIALFASGTMVMADDPVVEAVASSSPANPIASATFDMRRTSLGERRLNDSAPRLLCSHSWQRIPIPRRLGPSGSTKSARRRAGTLNGSSREPVKGNLPGLRMAPRRSRTAASTLDQALAVPMMTGRWRRVPRAASRGCRGSRRW